MSQQNLVKLFVVISAIVALVVTVGCSSTPDGATQDPNATIDPRYVQMTQVISDAAINKGLEDAQATANAMNNGTPTPMPTDIQPAGTTQPEVQQPGSTPDAALPTPMPETLAAMSGGNGTSNDGMSPYDPTANGHNDQWASDAYQPTQLNVSDCKRPWQAENKESTTWVLLFCNMRSSGDVQIWMDKPTHFFIEGDGTLQFLLVRDLRALEQMAALGYGDADPYQTFLDGDNSYPDENGLSVYWKGDGVVLNQFNDWIDFSNCAFFQVPFGREMAGAWQFTFDVNGTIELWLGSLEPATCGYGCGVITVENLFSLPYVKPNN